jgi:hypothetical protein
MGDTDNIERTKRVAKAKPPTDASGNGVMPVKRTNITDGHPMQTDRPQAAQPQRGLPPSPREQNDFFPGIFAQPPQQSRPPMQEYNQPEQPPFFEPSTQPPATRPVPPERAGNGKYNLADDEFRALVYSLYDENKTATEIESYMLEHGYNDENGNPIRGPKIAVQKRLYNELKKAEAKAAEKPPESETGIPALVAFEPHVPPSQDMFGGMTFQRKTKLDTYYQMLKEARDAVGSHPGDQATAAWAKGICEMAVDGIYKEMDKMDEAPYMQQMMGVLTGIITKKGEMDPLASLEKVTNIVTGLMGDRGSNESVEMARIVVGGVNKVTEELKDTVLTATGKRQSADKIGKCPNCGKLVPADSALCPYCGARFTAQSAPPASSQNPEPPIQDRQRQERKELAEAMTMPTALPPPGAHNGVQAMLASPEETMPDVLKNVKRLANFIADKDDPVVKADALWKIGNTDDRKQVVFMVLLGPDRIFYLADRMITKYPEYQKYYDICTSTDGQAWIGALLEEFAKLARDSQFKLTRAEVEKMMTDTENKLGFKIE